MAIYAVDFDGTLAVTRFPEIVEPKRKVVAAVSVKLLEGDITVAFILVPMGIVLITSKEMVIVNKYFWECEGKEWYL